jgi:hypothetical protein
MAERARTQAKELLSSLSAEEKVVAAEKVAALVASPGWDVIVFLLEGRRAKLLEGLVRHERVRSKAEYAAELAEVRGVEFALGASQAVLHAGEQSAKELTQAEGRA